MKNKKIKVLLFTDVWVAGGVPKYISDIVSRLDKDLFICSVLTVQKKTTLFWDIIEKNCDGAYIISSQKSSDPFRRTFEGLHGFSQALMKIKPDIIHMHASNGIMFLYAYLAKRIGVKCVVVHSHNTNFGNGHRIIKRLGHEMCRLLFHRYVDKRLACSKEAAEWMFLKSDQKEVENIKCFVDADKFCFDIAERKRIRETYGITEDVTIYINVGRFNYQKNHQFLIELFRLIGQNQNKVLFLIGEGELKEEIEKKIKRDKLENKVIIVEPSQNIPQYMSAADVFVLPSLFEGNPLTAIEAQASGLLCFVSNTITKEVKVSNNLYFIDIGDVEKSVDIINDICGKKRNTSRIEYASKVKKAGYDVERQIEQLQQIYSNTM